MKKILFLNCLFLIGAFSLISCRDDKNQTENTTVAQTKNEEAAFRPNFHFTPQENWMNDPNGMFYLDGIYHLFYQYYPEGNVWGPMHWGHASSTDMVTWEELPIALEPDELGYIFSGSAVVDENNTSGFGDGETPPVVAMFTYHDPEGEKEGRIDYQSQAIAYSLDKGKTWTKYEGNPVIANPDIKDFRDPKVIWDDQNQQWLMVLATVDRTLFYSSPNLKDWELISEFGEGTGAHDGVWECPDFFPMQVENSEEVKWVLIQSLNPGGYNGGSGTQYFVGDFNGKEFIVEPEMENLPEKHNYWIDYGKDNYAGVTWSNIPESDGRTLFIGWMSNWLYAQEVPTETWRSAMTVARELTLRQQENTYRIFSKPVKELEKYIQETLEKGSLQAGENSTAIVAGEIDLDRAVINFDLELTKNDLYEFALGNKEGDTLKFGFNSADNQFFIDRSESGLTDFSEEFANEISTAPRTSEENIISFEIVLDKTSIEIFYDNGETVMTEIFFPNLPYETLSAKGNSSYNINNVKLHQLDFSERNEQ